MSPTVKAIGTSLWVVWLEDQLTLEFSRIAEHTETITAELQVVTQATGEVTWTRFNLLAQTARGQVAKACAAACARDDWARIVDGSGKAVVRALRAGSPAIELVAKAPEPEWVADRWLVPDTIARGQINVLYGAGDSGKSWLALAAAPAGIHGHRLSSRWVVGPLRRVLYLDWESDADDHAHRLWALTDAREGVPPGTILYRRMGRPIGDAIDQVATEVAAKGVDLVITDSLGAASGADPETNEATLRTMRALRVVEATHLVLGHCSKGQLEQEGPRRLFGGIYNELTARCMIELRRRDDGDGEEETRRIVQDLYVRKNNLGRKAPPSALEFTWNDHHVHVRGMEADLSAAGIPTQILAILRHGPSSVSAIAERIGADATPIRVALNRLENRNKVIRLSVSGGARGKETQWGLIDAKRSNGSSDNVSPHSVPPSTGQDEVPSRD